MNINSPGPMAELLGQLAYAFNETQPFIPMYTHLILSALFPIITGAHASLSRPSSAAKPTKRKTKDVSTSDDEEEDEETVQKMEGLAPSDAIMFPLLAGCTLGGLYLLIKWMGPELLNKILRWYFAAMAVFSVAKLANDAMGVAEGLVWPKYYVDKGKLWHVKSNEKKAVSVGSEEARGRARKDNERENPLPGVLGRLNVGEKLRSALWTVRDTPRQKYLVRAYASGLTALRLKLTLRTLVSVLFGLGAVAYSTLAVTPWWLTNIQGFAFSYSAVQLMSPTTFSTGSLILGALFFYDIYFVFFTPLMVTVATKLDVPIKLLIPRPPEQGQDPTIQRMAMLGLGDIVLPGIVMGLALRFDLYMFYLKKQTKRNVAEDTTTATADDKAQDKPTASTQTEVVKATYRAPGSWGDRFWTSSLTGRSLLPASDPTQPGSQQGTPIASSFPKPYFTASVIGYVLGMCVTLGIMQAFKHAQPALLYLVPGVLGSVWLTAIARGELRAMWEFTELEISEETDDKTKENSAANEGKQDGEKEKEKGKSWWSNSFFGAEKSERNAKRLERALASSVAHDNDDARSQKDGDDANHDAQKDAASTKQDNAAFFARDRPNEIIFFSITRCATLGAARSQQSKTAASDSQAVPTNPASSRSSSSDAKNEVCAASRTPSTSSSDDAVLVAEADVEGGDAADKGKGDKHNWKEADIPGKGDERAGKRLRTQ